MQAPGWGHRGVRIQPLGTSIPKKGAPGWGEVPVPRSHGQGVAVLWLAPSSETGARALLAVHLMSDGFLNCSP